MAISDPGKALGSFAYDAEWVRVLSDVFRSIFVPLMHLIATNLTRCEPSSPPDLWKNHHGILITYIWNNVKRHQNLLRNDSDALIYALLGDMNSPSDMVTPPLSCLGTPAVRKDLSHLATYQQQDLSLKSPCRQVQCSISSFNTR